MTPAIFLAASVIGGALTALGHVLGSRAAKAAPGTDPYAGLPGLPGHPLLNAFAPAAGASPAPPAPAASPLAGVGPMIDLVAPLVERELAAMLAGAVRAAMAGASATPAPAAK